MKARSAIGLVAVALVVGCAKDEPPTGTGDPPPPPASVTATVVSNNITLTWAPVSGATNYRVYMAAAGGVKRVNWATLPEPMFHPDLSDKFDHPPGLTPGTEYFFVVTAMNASGESAESCEVKARISPATDGTC